MSIITLVTDFGTRDYYVGAMKGVLSQFAPKATIVDITHDIEPHDVLRAAFILRNIWPWYPEGTVHAVVVDPGVGTARSILVGRYAGQYVVTPDNGTITLVHHSYPLEALHVAKETRNFLPEVSSTFHGRDIIAPLAAKLSAGMPPGDVGPPTDRVEVLPLPKPNYLPSHVTAGVVLLADRFGNLVTNISREDLIPTIRHRPNAQVYVGRDCVGPIRSHYGEVRPGEPLAMIGSTNNLEISINRGSAAERFQSTAHSAVEVR
jgi:S-adenosylmethionine hydrolase